MTSEEIRNALDADEPLGALVEVVRKWKESGVEKEEAVRRLTAFRERLKMPRDDQKEDLVLEVLDFVEGWCVPGRRLY